MTIVSERAYLIGRHLFPNIRLDVAPGSDLT
jgi:hypothetical protein